MNDGKKLKSYQNQRPGGLDNRQRCSLDAASFLSHIGERQRGDNRRDMMARSLRFLA